MRRLALIVDLLGEVAAGALFVAYAAVAVAGIVVGVLAGLGLI